jgi:hypothetical protein
MENSTLFLDDGNLIIEVKIDLSPLYVTVVLNFFHYSVFIAPEYDENSSSQGTYLANLFIFDVVGLVDVSPSYFHSLFLHSQSNQIQKKYLVCPFHHIGRRNDA